jgi:hypothetical protein
MKTEITQIDLILEYLNGITTGVFLLLVWQGSMSWIIAIGLIVPIAIIKGYYAFLKKQK